MTAEERADKLIDALIADRGYGAFTAGKPCGDLWDDPQTLPLIAAAIREEVEAERERCAKVAEETFNEERLFEARRDGGEVIAAAIRSRP